MNVAFLSGGGGRGFLAGDGEFGDWRDGGKLSKRGNRPRVRRANQRKRELDQNIHPFIAVAGVSIASNARRSSEILLRASSSAADVSGNESVGLQPDSKADWRSNARVAVIGATGGVGFHVINRLLSKQSQVRAVVRDVAKAKESFGDAAGSLEFVTADVTIPGEQLEKAVEDVDAVVLCVGTTAFPSKAWKNGNSPKNVDGQGVENVMSAIERVSVQSVSKKNVKKIVALSSVGVLRKTKFPFAILNLFGVLDAKLRAEKAVIQTSEKLGLDYSILRPGRLVGGPYTNIGAIRKERGDNGIVLALGDNQSGDCAREDVAAVAVESIFREEAKCKAFTVVNPADLPRKSVVEEDDEWNELFGRLERPNEVLRLEFTSLNVMKLRNWLASWSGSVLTSGALYPPLPIPVRVDPTQTGCMLTFLTVDDGKVKPLGSLNIMLRPASEDGKVRGALLVFREPMFQDKPFLGEVQILDKLKDDLARVTTANAEEA
uniref:NAD(P)-binding domain-containing protein n=1 Tax=Timspurckia oligopyrenoides TaxID=708627 RepID=A0A7S0ZAU6_9RHOD|mmetsp:Transcript_10531/g.19007  ORF Transcript_10531/g.19007 Transcript_10531/m.19007 type:complete len:490 (+) Transcript_10531:204-1673(+)